MTISVFTGDIDAYWWVLCTEKYFKACRLSESEKMTVAATAMQDHALRWWLWWSHRHPASSWDTFTTDFLWRFKPEWRQILPALDEETEPDSEPLPSVEAPSHVDDSFANPVSNIIEQTDMEPLSIPKQEPLCLPSPKPSPPPTAITVPERRSTGSDSHGAATFMFHHGCSALSSYGNGSTHRALPPPKPPDRRFSTMFFPSFYGETIQVATNNSSLVLHYGIQNNSPPLDQQWIANAQSVPFISQLPQDPFFVSSVSTAGSINNSLAHLSSSDQHLARMDKSPLSTENTIRVIAFKAIPAHHVPPSDLFASSISLSAPLENSTNCVLLRDLSTSCHIYFISYVTARASYAFYHTHRKRISSFTLPAVPLPCSNAPLQPSDLHHFTADQLQSSIQNDPCAVKSMRAPSRSANLLSAMDVQAVRGFWSHCGWNAILQPHVSGGTMFPCFTNEPSSLIVVFLSSTVTFEYQVIGVLTLYNWVHTYVEFNLSSLAQLRTTYALKALLRGRLDLSFGLGNVAILFPMAQGDSYQYVGIVDLKIIGLFEVLLAAGCMHDQVVVMGIPLHSIDWSSLVNLYTDEAGNLFPVGFINVISACLTFWRMLLFIKQKEESIGNIEVHAKPIREFKQRVASEFSRTCTDDMRIMPGAIIFSSIFYEYFKYVGSNQGAALFLACKIHHWKQFVIVLLCDTTSSLFALLGSKLGVTKAVSIVYIMHTICSFAEENEYPLYQHEKFREVGHVMPLPIANNRIHIIVSMTNDILLAIGPQANMVLNWIIYQHYFTIGPPHKTLKAKGLLRDFKAELLYKGKHHQMLNYSVSFEKGQQWDPGGHFSKSKAVQSSQFKQWDPGKIVQGSNFYNLEDKVDFDGVGNVMILNAQKKDDSPNSRRILTQQF